MDSVRQLSALHPPRKINGVYKIPLHVRIDPRCLRPKDASISHRNVGDPIFRTRHLLRLATARPIYPPPAANLARNVASSHTVTPSACAFSNFEPAFSPHTSTSVFFDTEPVTLPPRFLISSAA